MPLSSHLSLPASPRAAGDARRWVVGICQRLGRHDIIDCVELGVSELVTNAVLHGAEPISVRVRGTASHPRIEVHDGSTKPPVPPSRTINAGEEDLLLTFGRGLELVARTATSCGASILSEGKIVWFEPATELRDGDDLAWVIDRTEENHAEPISDAALPVTLLNFDLDIYRTLARQYSELRRELRLLSLGHQDDYPLAGNLTAMFSSFERQFPSEYFNQVHRGIRAGEGRIDVHTRLLPESAAILETMGEMFDLADAFCRAQRLLSLARTPEQREFNNWLLRELISQLKGGQPQPWPGMPAMASGTAPSTSSRAG